MIAEYLIFIATSPIIGSVTEVGGKLLYQVLLCIYRVKYQKIFVEN